MTHLLDRLKAWEALACLVNLPWWTRVWVGQEINFSKDPILLWGEDTFLWVLCEEAMAMTTMWLGFIARDPDFEEVHGELQLKKGMQNARAVIRLCQGGLNKGPKRLLHLMDSFWLSEATDPRDKVYALLGLAADSHPESIIPNYESPVSLVYAESVKDTINREGNLQILSYCSGLFTPTDAAIPSWAPDWRSKSHDSKRPLKQRHLTFHLIERAIRMGCVTAKPEKYVSSAGGDSPPAVGFCKQMKTLYTVGIRVDVIFEISNTRGYDYQPREVIEEWSTLTGFNDHTNFYPPTGKLRADACVDTLTAGLFTPGSQPREVMEGIAVATGGRRFFVGEAGYQGLALSPAQMKDVIAVLLGGAYPLILRETEGHYIMVGEAYVHGIMNGELMTCLEDGQVELEEFEIW